MDVSSTRKHSNSNWREALAEKMALVESIDNDMRIKTDKMEADFDLVAFRHDHEAWLDTFHQRLAREEINIREKESVFPSLHQKIKKMEKNLSQQNVVLEEMFGEELKRIRAEKSPKRQSQIIAPKYVMEGWLTELTTVKRKRFYRLSPVTSTTPVRLYGFESDISKTPISIVQIPKKSTVTFNSSTKDCEWSFQLRTTDSVTKNFQSDTEHSRDMWISSISHEIKQNRG